MFALFKGFCYWSEIIYQCDIIQPIYLLILNTDDGIKLESSLLKINNIPLMSLNTK